MKKLVFLLCICIFLSACSKPQNSNNDTDSLKNSDSPKISDSVSAPDFDTSFHSADTGYPRATDTDDPSMINEISDDTITQLKKDFIKYHRVPSETTLDDIVIKRYLGTYQNDYIAVNITVLTLGYTAVIIQEDIAGYHFVYTQEDLYIYHDSIFTKLKEAYDTGIISKEDVASIYNEHDLYLSEHAPYFKKMKG